MKTLAPLVALFVLFLATAPAEGADVGQARAIFNAGAQAYEKGDYAGALEAFEAAYRIAPRPGILFSLAQAHRRQYAVTQDAAHIHTAVRLYREYLEKVSQGERRADAAQALVEIEPLASRLAASASTPEAAPTAPATRTRLMVSVEGEAAQISLDGQKPKGAPLIAEVPPGRHRIEASATGYFTESRDVVAVEGALVAVDIPLREQPGRIHVKAPAGADVWVDLRLTGKTPLGGPLQVTPGRRVLWIAKAGHVPREVVVNVKRGQDKGVAVQLSQTTERIAATALFVGAGAAAITGGVFTALSLTNQATAADVQTRLGSSNVSTDDVQSYEDARQRRDDFRTAAFVTFGSAVGLAIAGGVFYLSDRPPPPPIRFETEKPGAPKPRSLDVALRPLVAPTVSGFEVRGSF